MIGKISINQQNVGSAKKNSKKMIKKSEITVTSLGNSVEQLTIHAISNSESHGLLQ